MMSMMVMETKTVMLTTTDDDDNDDKKHNLKLLKPLMMKKAMMTLVIMVTMSTSVQGSWSSCPHVPPPVSGTMTTPLACSTQQRPFQQLYSINQ